MGVVSGASSTSQNGGPVGVGGLCKKRVGRTRKEEEEDTTTTKKPSGRNNATTTTKSRRASRPRRVGAILFQFPPEMVAETEESAEWMFLDGPIDEGKMHEFTKKENGKALVAGRYRRTSVRGGRFRWHRRELRESGTRRAFRLFDWFFARRDAEFGAVREKMRCDGEQKQFESVVLVSERDQNSRYGTVQGG